MINKVNCFTEINKQMQQAIHAGLLTEHG